MKINWKETANFLLDYVIESIGLSETSDMLMISGFTEEQLYYLGFEKDTIDHSKERVEKIEKEWRKENE